MAQCKRFYMTEVKVVTVG